MATVYSFGPFQLDDKSEILFRGKEPTTVGQRAVAPGQQGRVAGYFRHRAAIPRLLAAITDVAVDDSLAATTALDLVRRGDRSESYAFKHVLVCDALAS